MLVWLFIVLFFMSWLMNASPWRGYFPHVELAEDGRYHLTAPDLEDLLFGEDSPPPPVEPEYQWAVVNTNNALVWTFTGSGCGKGRGAAHSQWHKGERVLVISEQGMYVEVEADDQTKKFTHGCIGRTLLDYE